MKAPHFWSHGLDPRSREAAPLTRVLLTPLAALYAYGAARKQKSARPVDAGIPVICVGNLTSGGAGKSPVVAALREHLVGAGKRVATLSRGYGGRLKGPLQVDPATHTAADVGDEPLMLAADGEAWIGADRGAAGQAMASAGVDLILMDDGFQNPSLKKDISLIVVDAGAPFGNGYVIPKGPLREPIAVGLKRADAVILMGPGPVPAEVLASKLRVLRAGIQPVTPPPTGPLVAFAGIGRPEKVFDSLRKHGADLKDTVPFGDHHVYSASDLTYLRKLASDHSASLITTAKDYARLTPDARAGITAWPVKAVFEDTAQLDKVLSPITNRLST